MDGRVGIGTVDRRNGGDTGHDDELRIAVRSRGVRDRLTGEAVHDGTVAPADVAAMRGAWRAYRSADDVPALLERQMTRDLDTFGKEPQDPSAALRVVQNTTDLRLRYESVQTVDRDRFAMWARHGHRRRSRRRGGGTGG